MKGRTVLGTIALCAMLGLTGCAMQSEEVFDADQRLANKDFQIEPASYGVGCFVGAVAGGALGFLSGSEEVMAFGALGGCLLGGLTNKVLDDIRKNYYTKEGQLDALIARLEINYEKAHRLYVAAKQVYKEDHAKFTKLNKQIKKNKASITEMRLSLTRYEGNIAVLKPQLSSHKIELMSANKARLTFLGKEDIDESLLKDEKFLKENFTKEEVATLKQYNQQIAVLQTQLDDMQSLLNSYTTDRNVLNVALAKAEPDCYVNIEEAKKRNMFLRILGTPKEPLRLNTPECKLHHGKSQSA